MRWSSDLCRRCALTGLGLLLLISAGHAQTVGVPASDGNNSVCVNAEWKDVPFFGAAVSSSEFQPETLSLNSPYYRGPVERRLLPTAVLLGLAIVLLLFFLLWRIVRWLCRCCCRCCCVAPSASPERALTSAGMVVLKILVVLLALGVMAACAYGMSKVEPQLVSNGVSLLNNLQDFANSIFDVAYGVLGDVASVQGLLAQVQTILDVDVNATDISADLACIAPFAAALNPGQALSLLQAAQSGVASVDSTIPALASNYAVLVGTEVPVYQSNAAPLIAAPAFISSYSSDTNNFINAVSNLPGTYPGGTDGQTAALGAALQALDLPLSGTKHAFIQSTEAGLTGIYSNRSDDLSTLNDLSTALSALSTASANLSVMVPDISAELIGVCANYTATRPCMVELLSRLDNINSTVVVLPSDINNATLLLQSLTDTLDTYLLNGTTPAPALAAQLSEQAANMTLQPFPNSTVTSLDSAQNQLSNMDDPSATGGPVQYLQALDSANQGASSYMDQCNSAYQSFASSPSSGAYTTLVSNCQAASSAMSPVQSILGASNSGAGAAFTASAQAAAQTSTAFAALPTNTAVQTELSSAQASVDALPDIGTYIAALGPAAAASSQLSPSLFSDLQSEITSFASSIQQAISSANATLGQDLGTYTSKANDIHNQTLDRVTAYSNEYEPQVYHYDRIRQAVEYVYFALAIVACLGLVFAVLTNCQWAAGFFTLLLAVLCVLFGIVAVLLFALASVGNDACTSAEAYLVRKIPDWVTNPSTANKTLTALDYYLFDEGGPVPELAQSIAGINITDILAQQLLGNYTLQSRMQAIVDGVDDVADSVSGSIATAEDLASFDSVHPLYIQAKTFLCCSGVNMLGDLWAANFAAVSISVFLIVCMFAYIGKLDRLPPRACCGCAMRSSKEFQGEDEQSQFLTKSPGPPGAHFDEGPVAGSGRSINIVVNVDPFATPQQQQSFSGGGMSRQGSGMSRQASGPSMKGSDHHMSPSRQQSYQPGSPSAPPYSPSYARQAERYHYR